jgi:hypothetical protein
MCPPSTDGFNTSSVWLASVVPPGSKVLPRGEAPSYLGEGALERVLRGCDEAAIGHHSRPSDLSRWITAVLRDPRLAAAVQAIEADVAGGAADGRERLLRAIREYYPR